MRIVWNPDSWKHSPAECDILVIALRAKAPRRSTSLAWNFTFWILNVWQWPWSFVNWSDCVLAWLVWAPRGGLYARDDDGVPDGAFPAKICFLFFVIKLAIICNCHSLSLSLFVVAVGKWRRNFIYVFHFY